MTGIEQKVWEDFFMGFFDRFSTDIGIDLGTCNTLIYVRGKGIVVDEPSVVAVEKGTKHVWAVGAEAKRMLWKTPGNIEAIRPLADGVIADIDSCEKMIKYFISKVISRHQLFKSTRMKIGIPSCITQVERRAVIETALKAGAKEVDVIEESFVKEAKDRIEHNKIIDVVMTLPIQQQKVLEAINYLTKRNEEITSGRLYEVYQDFAKNDKVSYRRIFDFINELEMLGLISANTVSRGRGRGRTNVITLQCDSDLIDNALSYRD